jgi:protein disulfide-isomerase
LRHLKTHISIIVALLAFAQVFIAQKNQDTLIKEKMKVEIWSDIMCPFCYIGKRHLEAALQDFPGKENIDIVWKSFQLNPNLPMVADSSVSTYEYLAKAKGMSVEQSIQMHNNVVAMAKNVGLDYHFEKSIVANSIKAHRVLQMAKTKGLGDALKERLLKAYFTDGKDMSDNNTLITLGKEVGLSQTEVEEALTNERYLELVKKDVEESQKIGVQGVPFFVFDRKYGISGAQPIENFVQTIEKSYNEWRAENVQNEIKISEGPVCKPDGTCE